MAEYPKAAYLKCENSGGRFFDEMALRFEDYEGKPVAGFFSLRKLKGNLLEVEVLEETEDKSLIDLPRHGCHVFSGGKRHYVNRNKIIYPEEIKTLN